MNWYQRNLGWIPRPVRRVIVVVIGGTLLLLALLGSLLPIIPGFIFVPLALAVLAAEFAWAARWLFKIKMGAQGAQQRIKRGWRWLNGRQPAPVAQSPCVERSANRGV